MILPIRTDSPLRRTPWMNWLLILANVAIFIFQEIHPGLTHRYELNPRDPHLLNYFTYAFLHDPRGTVPLHLIFNMLFLYIFGNNVNDKMGSPGLPGVLPGRRRLRGRGIRADGQRASHRRQRGGVGHHRGLPGAVSPLQHHRVLLFLAGGFHRHPQHVVSSSSSSPRTFS